MKVNYRNGPELDQVDHQHRPESQRIDGHSTFESLDQLGRIRQLDLLDISDMALTVSRVLDLAEASRAAEIEDLRRSYMRRNPESGSGCSEPHPPGRCC